MKKIILILFILIVTAIGYGFYIKNTGEELKGDRVIGLAVLAIAFVFMPLFIIYRSRGKKFKDYMLTKENFDKMKEKDEVRNKKN
ncbi:hypothetical protein [Abyssalbus ytuae]|uniref:Uncharacterized protein n=1 Tax=Abyssalbus ytuae TaxID=2926907 RepID=A0A9E7CSB4_9FLAO|nr:hypothetical protein [Abyssalbus ytuae]UOB15986.1 hypothetical protein MQE35_09560 [Abyssalbus ytuae]